MRTKFFKEESLSEDGKKHLQTLAGLSITSASLILDWFESRNSYPRFDHSERSEIANATGESGDTLVPVLGVLKLIIDRIVRHDEDIRAFYDDVKDLKLIDDEVGYETLDVIFARLPGLVEKFLLFKRKFTTESYGLPVLTGSTMSAALKPVFRKKFDYDEDNIEKYKPSPIGFTVVAMCELENDSRDVFVFQVNRDNFDRIVIDLLALQAEMKILEDEAIQMTKRLGKD